MPPPTATRRLRLIFQSFRMGARRIEVLQARNLDGDRAWGKRFFFAVRRARKTTPVYTLAGIGTTGIWLRGI